MLIIEDNESVLKFLQQTMRETGYTPTVTTDGNEGLHQAITHSYDMILLDLMLPGMDGFEICRKLRELGKNTPILLITARDSLEDKVKGLDSGADDYIVKPFLVKELLARIRALMRRGNFNATILQVEDLILDPVTRRATRGGKQINLSSTEYMLLEYLMRNAGRVLTRAMILEQVWQYDFGGNDNVLDVYISYLRGKIDRGRSIALIHTVRGVGYIIGNSDSP